MKRTYLQKNTKTDEYLQREKNFKSLSISSGQINSLRMKLLRFTAVQFLILLLALPMSREVYAAGGSIVTINLNVLPPYSPFYRDYAGYTNNKTLVTLLYQNVSSGAPIQIYLSGSIRKDDNSISVQVKDSYRPAIPITLNPNIPQILTGVQLRNIFGNGSSNDLIMNGITTRSIVMNQALPEGNYNICIQAKNYATGEVLSEACQSIYIAYYEPPQIYWPLNNGIVTATNPQNVIVSWSPVTPAIQGLNYRLRVAKLLPGISPMDALNYSTQVVYERSEIKSPTFLLDLASGLRLDTGKYVMQVVAYSPLAYFKNNGQSDPVVFDYVGNPALNIPIHHEENNSQLTLINPGPQNDTLSVNNDKKLLFSWSWLKMIHDIEKGNHYEPDDTAAVKINDVSRYEVSIFPSGRAKKDSQFSFTKTIQRKEKGTIDNKIEINEAGADSIGFADGTIYNFTLRTYNSSGQEAVQPLIHSFFFKKLKEDIPLYHIPVQASIKYAFQGEGKTYPAGNTGVTIDALVKWGNNTKWKNAETPTDLKNNFSNNPLQMPSSTVLTSLPGRDSLLRHNNIIPVTENIGKDNYVSISSSTATTDENGNIRLELAIPQNCFSTDSIYYRLKINNKYYVDRDFKLMAISTSLKDTAQVSFGSLIAKTYAYSLKLNVTKAYTSYNLDTKDGKLNVQLGDTLVSNNAGYAYNVNSEKMKYYIEQRAAVDSLPVILFRKNKSPDIPVFEGDITSLPDNTKPLENSYTIVATGTTKRENDSTYVTFDRLLSSSDDEYFILAVNNNLPIISKKTQASGNSSGNQQGIYLPILQAISSGSTSDVIFQDGFVAQKQLFKLAPPNPDAPDAYYRHVKAKYEIISSKPPTSLVKGKLYYTWKSDPTGQKRPLANTRFKIVVDYLADGKSAGSSLGGKTLGNGGGTAMKTQYFVPQGQDSYANGISMIDQYATMAIGKTDAQGNFQIEVVNINPKKDLGSGLLVQHGWKAPSTGSQTTTPANKNPTDKKNWKKDAGSIGEIEGIGTQGIENSINGGPVLYDSNTGSYTVGKSLNQLNIGASILKTPIQFAFAPPRVHPGPYPEEAPQTQTETALPISHFSRTYRVVPLGENNEISPFYYPAKDTFFVQAFETLNSPVSSNCYVKEFKLNVETVDAASPKGHLYDGITVTVFRDLQQKQKDLPLGEGDGQYYVNNLISPLYNTQSETANTKDAKDLNSDNLFTNKFEYLQPNTDVPQNSLVSFERLLQQQYLNSFYYVEGCSNGYAGKSAYKATFKTADNDGYPLFDDGDPGYWTGENDIPEQKVTLALTQLDSRLLFQVKNKNDQALPGDGAKATICINNKGESGSKKYPADRYGYKELLIGNLAKDNLVKGNQINLSAHATAQGYKPSQSVNITGNNKGYQFVCPFQLEPSAIIYGRIVSADEQTNGNYKGVAAFLKIDTGKVVVADDNGNVVVSDGSGNFNFPIPAVAGTKIRIIPKDVAYFDTIYVMSPADTLKKSINIGNFKVFRRKHRLQFNVKSTDNKPIYGATIQLGDTLVKTKENGIAELNFENVSVNNYTFAIKGPSGKGYIPQTINLVSPETRTSNNIPVVLENGRQVSGKVTLDNIPVKHAKVYLDVSEASSQRIISIFGKSTKLNDDANLVATYSDASGNYTLQGIPADVQQVRLIATLDTTAFTVIGASQAVNLQNNQTGINFALTSFKGAKINNLFGFPLSVESLTEISPNQVKVTGLINWKAAISDFSLNEVNKVLRVEDVVYDLKMADDKSLDPSQTSKNSTIPMIAVPHDDIVPIQGISELKLSYLNKYNVKLETESTTNSNNGPEIRKTFNLSPQQLLIQKEDDYGKIKGKIHIVDNSFNYPSSYLSFPNSDFYFAHKNVEGHLTNTLSVMTSPVSETNAIRNLFSGVNSSNLPANLNEAKLNNLNAAKSPTLMAQKSSSTDFAAIIAPKKPYYLTDSMGDSIRFKLIEFDATANPAHTFIDEQGKIHISASLKCEIPNAKPESFNVNIDDMVIDENKVYPATNESPINLSLEKWNLKVKDWKFDVQQGGITSSNAYINTSVIDIPLESFVLRHDMFYFGADNIKKLTLAGGKIPISEINGTPHLNYDYKTGKYMTPHWSFGIVQKGNQPVAKLPHLKGLGDASYQIGLNYIQMLSDNEVIIQLQQQNNSVTLKGNNLAQFSPQQIFNGPDYLSVSGALNVGAQRVGDIPLSFTYDNLNKEMEFERVTFDFEGRGFVHFSADQQDIHLTQDTISVTGLVEEKPVNTFNPLQSVFIAQPNPKNDPMYNVMVIPNQVTQLTGESNSSNSKGFSLKISKGGMSAQNRQTDWSTLSFSGLMASNGVSGFKPCQTTFNVLGDVSANSDSLSVTNIPTHFGAMTQTFDFANKRLLGSLKINSIIPLGVATLNSGTIETCFDPKGFYVAGGCNATLNVAPLAGIYNLGFMVGIYNELTPELWNKVNSYIDPSIIDNCYFNDAQSAGLKGFYFAVNRELLNTTADWDFILASGYIRAKALLGGDFYMNILDATTGGSGHAYLNFAAGLSTCTGTSISGSIGGQAGIYFNIDAKKPSLDFNTDMGLKLDATVSQSLGFTSIHKPFSIGCLVSGGTGGFGFHFGSGSITSCPNPSK